ncbi:MAG: AzlC family ABC transporter permease [Lentisphaeria bacterium]|nr:AzlC family ABC transporter permease [Lentisphaeria bacterium]
MSAKTVRAAFVSSMPVLMGYLTMGMAFGILLSTQVRGADGLTAAVMSFFTISGSMQFAAVEMLRNADAYSLALTAVLALVINIRYTVYGLPFLRTFRPYPRPLKYYLIGTLTDETYAIETQDRRRGREKRVYLFCVAFFDHMYWVVGSVAGAVLGSLLPFDTSGVDFAMAALFIVVLVDLCRDADNRIPAVIGGSVTAAVLAVFVAFSPGHVNKLLLPAMAVTIALLLALRGKLQKAREEGK